jgi:uncharacterized membrane protein
MMEEDRNQEGGGSSLAIPENVAGVLCYALGWVSGLIMFFVEKKSKFVRFHALQSLITFGILSAAALVFRRVPVLGTLIGVGTGILGFAAWVMGMLRAYQGEKFKFPLVGDVADRQALGP